MKLQVTRTYTVEGDLEEMLAWVQEVHPESWAELQEELAEVTEPEDQEIIRETWTASFFTRMEDAGDELTTERTQAWCCMIDEDIDYVN